MAGKEKRFSFPSIFAIFGWLMGGLSLLNLLSDLSPLELYGSLKQWVDAYAIFVEHIRLALFSWINWRWIALDRVEAHLIVLASLLTASVAKAGFIGQKDSESFLWNLIGNTAASISTNLLPVILAVLLLPGTFGLMAGAFLFAILFYTWTYFRGDDPPVEIEEVRRQLLVVAAVLVLIVAINYLVFRPR